MRLNVVENLDVSRIFDSHMKRSRVEKLRVYLGLRLPTKDGDQGRAKANQNCYRCFHARKLHPKHLPNGRGRATILTRLTAELRTDLLDHLGEIVPLACEPLFFSILTDFTPEPLFLGFQKHAVNEDQFRFLKPFERLR
jgi:hypothetical protein